MSTRDDIAAVYRADLHPPVVVPAWATLPIRESDGRWRADGWSVLVVTDTYIGPERRSVPREPRLIAHGSRVLPREAGWLFGARAR
jgi:hypothetical protein